MPDLARARDAAAIPAVAPVDPLPTVPNTGRPVTADPDAATPAEVGELTRLLRQAADGDPEAFDVAFSRVYAELLRLAHRVRAGRATETLDAPALVHEAYLKLAASAGGMRWGGRSHFFAVAARAMRQVLVGAARERLARKRGGGQTASVTLDERAFAAPERASEMLALDEALERLVRYDERQARVVELRFFAGLKAEEVAEVLAISVPTVQRDWKKARAWLLSELGEDALMGAVPGGHQPA